MIPKIRGNPEYKDVVMGNLGNIYERNCVLLTDKYLYLQFHAYDVICSPHAISLSGTHKVVPCNPKCLLHNVMYHLGKLFYKCSDGYLYLLNEYLHPIFILPGNFGHIHLYEEYILYSSLRVPTMYFYRRMQIKNSTIILGEPYILHVGVSFNKLIRYDSRGEMLLWGDYDIYAVGKIMVNPANSTLEIAPKIAFKLRPDFKLNNICAAYGTENKYIIASRCCCGYILIAMEHKKISAKIICSTYYRINDKFLLAGIGYDGNTPFIPTIGSPWHLPANGTPLLAVLDCTLNIIKTIDVCSILEQPYSDTRMTKKIIDIQMSGNFVSVLVCTDFNCKVAVFKYDLE